MKILLATDGSEYSETAARYIQRLGLGAESEVVLLHALKEYLVPDSVDPSRDFVKAGRRAAQALVEDAKRFVTPTGARVSTAVREGTPWQEILEGAEESGSDLIVMGHKGHSSIAGYLIGSVAHQVVRNGDVSTFIVRELPPTDRPVRALYCTDGSPGARRARDMFGTLFFNMDVEVEVLSIVDMEVESVTEKYYPDEDVSLMMAELREHSRKVAEGWASEDAEYLRRFFGKVGTKVAFGIPDVEIIRESEDLGADIVVMGSKSMHGLTGLILGSAAHRVLKHADCSVLIAKAPNHKTG
ncbi:MAG: universal stress protein [Nitrospirae bacterium]|nr:universal stress protein [Nitrospirota bacterium]